MSSNIPADYCFVVLIRDPRQPIDQERFTLELIKVKAGPYAVAESGFIQIGVLMGVPVYRYKVDDDSIPNLNP